MQGAEERMEKFVEEMEAVFKELKLSEVTHKVLMGDVAEQIVDYATEIVADMIIMGTHGYKGLEKVMFGSVADKVVRSALCPVTTINPYTCCFQDE
jgi:nucleotide-binding universal stress UspA family protein